MSRPTVVFAMKYPDQEGNVWSVMSRLYDHTAALLAAREINAIVCFPKLTDQPAYQFSAMDRHELDLCRRQDQGFEQQVTFLKQHNAKVICFTDVGPRETDIQAIHQQGIRTVNYAQYNFPDDLQRPIWRHWADRLRYAMKLWMHDLYIANCQRQANKLMAFGIPDSHMVTVTNGVDTDFFNKRSATTAKDLDLPQAQWYATIVCQSRPEKRVDLLIQAADRLFQQRPDLSLCFIYAGDGGMKKNWQRMAEDLKLSDRFIFKGQQTPDQVADLYTIAHMHLHASEREGLSFALCEASSCQLPVICTNVGGAPETFDNGSTGILINPGDIDGFTNAMASLIDEPDNARQMGQAGRKRIIEHFSLKRQAQQLAEHLYHQVVQAEASG